MVFRKFAIIFVLTAPCLVRAQDQTAEALPTNFVNRELPDWMHFNAGERVRAEYITGDNFEPSTDRYLLNLLQLNMTVQPLSWLSFSFQAQDARVFGQNARPAPTSQKDAINLSMGYLQLGSDDAAVVLRAGRQSLDFGDGRLVSDQGWTNVGLSFDAARISLRRASAKLDLFSGVSVKVNPLGFDLPTPGEHFHGAYGSWGGLVPQGTIEPYVFWRLEHNWSNAENHRGELNEKTFGLRWSGKLPFGLDYVSETAGQTGSSSGERIAAWMGHWQACKTLLLSARTLRLFAEYSRASGQTNPGAGVQAAFDPLFENPHDPYGLTDLFSSSNLVQVRTGFHYALAPSLTLSATFNRYWLATSRDGLYVRGAIVARSQTGAAGTDVGWEPDAQGRWTITHSTQLTAGYGRLLPGGFLRRATQGCPYNLVLLSLTQQF